MTPESILAYFERLSVEYPAADDLVDGAEATREWMELMNTKDVSQERIDALLTRIREQETTMAGMLCLYVQRWALEAGWRVL
jgi:hypothetical protein